MKLKLKTSSEVPPALPAAPPANSPPPETPSGAAGGLKLKFKPMGAPPAPISASPVEAEPAIEPVKQKRKYTRKPKVDDEGNPLLPGKPGRKPAQSTKRGRENGEEGSPATKRRSIPSAKLQAAMGTGSEDEEEADMAMAVPVAVPRPIAPQRTQSLKISIKQKGQEGDVPVPGVQRAPTLVRLKGVKGKPPVRPPGVGYDSEAEEAEDDPAIESQFVLRMQPGDDCDELRRAIEEKKIGTGGKNVNMRFLDREGRRAIVSVFNHLYAATMVDLPCVIESMKSWNKKDWVKTADICQMLLVLGPVKNEEEAKSYKLPKEVDHSTHQYAHGLTPPMHWVRKRRFRPRVSYRRIEEVEEIVEALLDEDRKIKKDGGRSDYTVADANEISSSEEESEDEDEDMMDAPGEYIDGETPTIELETSGLVDPEMEAQMLADMEAEMAAVLADGGGDADLGDLFGSNGDTQTLEVEVATPQTAHDVAMNILHHGGDHTIATTEPAAESPAAASTPATQSADDDDDASSDEDSPTNEADAERNNTLGALEEEIRELEDEIANVTQARDATNNIIMKRKKQKLIDTLQEDLSIKKATLANLKGGEED
ncbi:TAFII55 protein conserved region-domain-containing protein [Lophiotrema nucula]|uniref:TAFII55 protein conserved region-domain-containing protein n=1 Tax=Lophiotrema nucula TaxID=690887 RepID=A0A6A5ZHA3_9PLEO|nr:TAFII55 protein conserved region-domain-containing protein [Lophiotrema nucula]